MDDDMEDVLREFLEESRESIDLLDRDLVLLEKTPDASDLVARIFRAVHTIKGTCGFLGFGRLEAVTHAGENVLSALREHSLEITPHLTSVLLSTVDAIREMLAQIEATASDGEGDYSVLIAQLQDLQRPGVEPSPSAAPEPAAAPLPSHSRGSHAQPSDSAAPQLDLPMPQNRLPLVSLPDVNLPPGGLLAVAVAAASPASGNGRANVANAERAANGGGEAASSDSSIRVDVGLLDKLMNLVGELVLARNQIIQFKGAGADSMFLGASQRLNLITSELQEGVMKTRMQPIGNIWHKFPRVVRDLALACGKRVRLEMEGEQTELDKTLIEAIKDPLTHLVRNSVDHGIELPAQRLAAQKPSEGCLRLRAFHEGGQVNIEISDDGAGLDSERIGLKAVERGITTAEQVARMSERELFRLIFLPGFSTAANVTNVSGRGVGMDVVKTNIERIGGTVELQSQRGSGSSVRIKIPLTLAIIRGVIVKSGKNRYVIPQASVLKLIRLEGAEALRAVENIHGAPVYRLRGKLLPLVYLADVLEDSEAGPEDVVNIVVLKADDRQFGVVVHAVQDTEEIVVKPLGKHLKGTSVFAGATIMGDGLVALILDIVGLAKRARIVSEGDARSRQEVALAELASNHARQTLLLVRSPGNGRMAMPLSKVERLEEFPLSLVERAGNERLVQYRGQIMPILDLKSLLAERRAPSRLEAAEATELLLPTDTLQVVVCSHQGGQVGLIVDQILDIVEDTLAEPRAAGRPGVLGSVVILGRLTELLDVEAMLRCAGPGGESRPPAARQELAGAQHGA